MKIPMHFNYKTIFNRKTWLCGAGFYTPWQERPVVITQLLQYVKPFHISGELDSLAFKSSLYATLAQIPFDKKPFTSTLNTVFFNLKGNMSDYYLNVSGTGYSTVFSGMPISGPGIGLMWEPEYELSPWMRLIGGAGFASMWLDSIRGLKINPAKYEVVSDGNYSVKGSASLKGFLFLLGFSWKFPCNLRTDQSLAFARLYPDYSFDWIKSGLFTNTTYGGSRSPIVSSDFRWYHGAIKLLEVPFEAELSFDQGIPMHINYRTETEENTGGAKRKDRIIGLERIALTLTYQFFKHPRN